MNTEKEKKVLQNQSEVGTPLEVSSRVAESVSLLANTKLHTHMPSISFSAITLGTDLTDFGIPYYTLVADGAIPIGFMQDFVMLETPARRAAKRQQVSASSISDPAAKTRLRSLH